ncbi:ABC transporter permease [Psychrobacillus sp. FSL K6-2684]|uniref:ABC transporter permease n=1 Tax=Psychrobacillus sp. FSL K6-2684 TaxID=2921547 RepID=UPI0030F67E00
MLLSLISKQLKMLVRNKQPLIILLVMPIVLITILSSALAGVMNRTAEGAIQADLVIVDSSSWEQESEEIKLFLENEGLAGPAQDSLLQTLEENDPIFVLQNSILSSTEIEKYLKVENGKAEDLGSLRKNEQIDGILSFPVNFRLEYIKYAYFNTGEEPKFELFLNQNSEIRASIVQSIIEEWQRGYSHSLALTKAGIPPNKVIGATEQVIKIEQVLPKGERTVPSSIYNSIGMLVMFALYIPSFLAGFALQEVQWKVYDRIILAGVSSTLYVLSILITGTIVALIQQALVLMYGSLALGIDWIGWPSMAVIVLSFSLFIGGLSALLTTLQFKTGTEGVANVFNGLVITIFSFLGGSFFKISDISETLANLGSYTPNGATMKAILSIQSGEKLSGIWLHLNVLYIGIFICVLLSIILFPRRGAKS